VGPLSTIVDNIGKGIRGVPGHLPQKGLVAFWSADGHAKDSLGKHHGTIQGNVKYTTGRNGKAGGAFLFDGRSGFVKIPDKPELDTDHAFTLSLWINPKAYKAKDGRSFHIMDKWFTATVHADYTLTLVEGRVRLYVCAAAWKEDRVESKSVVPKNTWTHIAGTFDRGALKLYINGTLEAAKVSAVVKRTDPTEYTHDDVCIGANCANAWHVDGAIDDVGIWNRALSDVEIAIVAGALPGLPQVTRKADMDRVALKDGNILLGTIENRQYTLSAFFGKIDVPAKEVVGLVQADKQIPHPRLILTGGQVVAGKLTGKTVQLVLPATGSALQVPVGSIRQFGYRISKEKPADPTSPGAMVVLRSGDRLAWTEMKHKLQLVTSYARVDLPTESIRTIELGGKMVRGRRVQLGNGSTLTGALLPNRLKLKLKLGPVAEVYALQLLGLDGPARPVAPVGGTTMVMRNGDRLLGHVADKTLTIRTSVGEARIQTTSIFVVEFEPKKPGAITVKTWGGGVMTGRLVEPTIAFAIAPGGATVKAKTAQIASITRTSALPPPEVRRKVEQLVAQLGAESFQDRQAAGKALVKMGRSIVPLLKPHLKSNDPEIRQRIQDILEQLGVKE